MSYDPFFAPFQYKSLNLRNRFVMAPMTRVFSPDGIPTPAVADYYSRRAIGEVGLIITEGTVIDRPSSKFEKGIPNFYGDEALAGWKKVADSVHSHHGSIAPQLWHVGDVTSPMTEWTPGVPMEGPGNMSVADIQATIQAYATAAKNAKDLGFDAIEIHAAHGYLIDQFFWVKTNTRTDHYGGKSILERGRFAIELVEAIRAAVGPEMAIIMRLSQWKSDDFGAKLAHNPKEMEQWILPLANSGVDIFHGSQRRYWEPEFEGSDLNLAGWFKKITGQPSITVGSVGFSTDMFSNLYMGESSTATTLDELLRRYERGDFDLVAVGRAILQEPDWVKKVHTQKFDNLKAFDKESLYKLY